LAAAYAWAGHDKEAKKAAGELLELDPEVTVLACKYGWARNSDDPTSMRSLDFASVYRDGHRSGPVQVEVRFSTGQCPEAWHVTDIGKALLAQEIVNDLKRCDASHRILPEPERGRLRPATCERPPARRPRQSLPPSTKSRSSENAVGSA
jgi:hypothetical protein